MKYAAILFLSCLSLCAQSPLTTGSGIDWTRSSSAFDPTSISGLYFLGYCDSLTNWGATTPNTDGNSGVWTNLVSTSASTRGFTNFFNNGTAPIYCTNCGPGGVGFAVNLEGRTAGTLVNFPYEGTGSNQPNTMFMVATDTTSAGQNFIFDCLSGSRSLFAISTVNNSGGMSSGTGLTFPPDPNTGNWFIYTTVWNGNNSYYRTNGVKVVAGPVGAAGFGVMMLGNDQPFGAKYHGKMVAMLIYQAALATNDLINVERFLNTRYSLGYTIPGP